MTNMKQTLQWWLQHARPWLLIAFLVSAATLCSRIIDPYVSLTSQAMVYVLAVVIASSLLNWVQSVSCAIGAVAALNFFFVPPRWTLQVENPEHYIALLTMLVVAIVINRLTSAIRQETATAHRNEQRATQLQELAIALAAADTMQDIIGIGQHALDRAFSGRNILALTDPHGEMTFNASVDTAIQDGLRCCIKEATILGPGTGRWTELDAWYLPLGEKNHMVGAVCVQTSQLMNNNVSKDRDTEVDSDREDANDSERDHARALCTILAQAILRLQLTASVLTAQAEAQRQQLQGIFLAAISHDLRTPLAVVVGAASALQTQYDKLDRTEQVRLLNSIVNEANYLATLTENTLQLISLSQPFSNASHQQKHRWESMEEIVGAVLARVRQHDPNRRIRSKVAAALPLVKVDPVLIAQVISNLLDNALKYTDSSIELSVQTSEAHVMVSVKDRGPGISESEQGKIFDAFASDDHTNRSTQRGAGLGLALCKAIAQIHGGSLRLQQRKGGGSNFTLQLPVDAQENLALGKIIALDQSMNANADKNTDQNTDAGASK